MVINKIVFNFYKQAQPRFVFFVKNHINSKLMLPDLSLHCNFSITSDYKKDGRLVVVSENQIDMKFGGLGVTKRIGKNIHLYNKVQKNFSNEILLKFVGEILKKRDFLFKNCN